MDGWPTRIPCRVHFTFVLFYALSLGVGSAQGDQQITDQLNQGERQRSTVVVAGTCGSFGMQGAAFASSLVRSGTSAIPKIDAAIASIKEKGLQSPSRLNANWLLYAYATIEGSAAFPKLQQLRGDPNFAFLDIAIDIASALSLGQTSYVSSWRRPLNDPCIAPTPREALDQLILAWENNDRALLKDSLGPEAAAALDALLRGTGWENIRSRLWHVRKSNKTAVGYRFELPAPWSDPAVTLEIRNVGFTLPFRNAANSEVETFFKDGSGRDCGRFRLRLSPAPSGGSYLVDNADLGALLEVISRCAAN